jgi:hypothetical protein
MKVCLDAVPSGSAGTPENTHTENEQNQENQQKYAEQQFGNGKRRSRNSGESQKARNQAQYQKQNSQSQHLFVHLICDHLNVRRAVGVPTPRGRRAETIATQPSQGPSTR